MIQPRAEAGAESNIADSKDDLTYQDEEALAILRELATLDVALYARRLPNDGMPLLQQLPWITPRDDQQAAEVLTWVGPDDVLAESEQLFFQGTPVGYAVLLLRDGFCVKLVTDEDDGGDPGALQYNIRETDRFI